MLIIQLTSETMFLNGSFDFELKVEKYKVNETHHVSKRLVQNSLHIKCI